MWSRALLGGATLEVHPDAAAAAHAAARHIAAAASEAVEQRGRFNVALSGGSTPLAMFRALTREPLPWEQVQLFQVDERVVAFEDAARNARQIQEALLSRVQLSAARAHWIPVEAADAALEYSRTLSAALGQPAVLDLVHLGLGEDGHTASLVPGDPALDVLDSDVAEVAEYRGHPRVSLTFPALNRARAVLWLVCGPGKRRALHELIEGNSKAPAGRVQRARALILADEAAVERSSLR